MITLLSVIYSIVKIINAPSEDIVVDESTRAKRLRANAGSVYIRTYSYGGSFFYREKMDD